MVSQSAKLMPSALSMPLRDVLRGLRGASESAEGLLSPAGDLVPPPIRDVLRGAARVAERAGTEVLGAAVPRADQIAAAAAYLVDAGPSVPRETLAKVITYGAEAYLARHGTHPALVSETVLAVALGPALAAQPQVPRAEAVIDAIVQGAAIGPAPGTPFVSGEDAQKGAQLAAFATVLWLLVERAQDLAEEYVLLDLCIGLTHAQRVEILEAFAAPDLLPVKLSSLAEIV